MHLRLAHQPEYDLYVRLLRKTPAYSGSQPRRCFFDENFWISCLADKFRKTQKRVLTGEIEVRISPPPLTRNAARH